MLEWLTEATNAALVLVIISVMALVGGSFSGGGITFDLKTAKGKSYLFIILVGVIGLFIIVFDFIYYLDPPHLVQSKQELKASSPRIPQTNASDIGVYDDFSNPAFDNTFDGTLWTPSNIIAGQIAQRDGILMVTNKAQTQGEVALTARKYENFKVKDHLIIEAKLKVTEARQEGHVYIVLSSDVQTEDYTDCMLGYGDIKASISCTFSNVVGTQDRTLFETSSSLVALGIWHTVRIELQPSTMIFTYYSDGVIIGSYSPTNAEALKTAEYNIDVGVWAEQSSKALTGYIDDVKIGGITQ